jgi:hypothetical protein
MPLTNGKYKRTDIDGQMCTVIENEINGNRAAFLIDLLEFNKIKVIKKTIEGKEDAFLLAVPDVRFNPVIAVYNKKLKTKDNRVVTPNYWNQIDEYVNLPYWTVTEPIKEAYLYKEPEK